MKHILTIAAFAAFTLGASAQSTNLAPFNLDVNLATWQAVSNAWAAHQTACQTSSNYVGRTVRKELVVTNEVTGEGYQTNIVTKQNTAMGWPKFRALVAKQANMEAQLVEVARRIGDAASRYTASPIVATNTSPGTATDKDN